MHQMEQADEGWGQQGADARLLRVFEVVRAHVLEVLADCTPEQLTPQASITALGGNSIDRAEVAMLSMETLGLRMPRTALTGARNLGELARLLAAHADGSA